MGILPMEKSLFDLSRGHGLDVPHYIISRITEGGYKHRVLSCTSLSKGVFLIGRLRDNHPGVVYQLDFIRR